MQRTSPSRFGRSIICSREGLNDESYADMATIKARLTQFRHSEEIKNLAAMTLAYRKMVRQIDKYWDK